MTEVRARRIDGVNELEMAADAATAMASVFCLVLAVGVQFQSQDLGYNQARSSVGYSKKACWTVNFFSTCQKIHLSGFGGANKVLKKA